ncbi:hypothetical protein LguiB_029606 [Lonicera macranthoides]
MTTRERRKLPPAQETIEKLEKIVNEGNHYGAQQMYKSISSRYLAAERYTEALDLLQAGACIQLGIGQVTCGAELATLFVDALIKGKFGYHVENLDRVRIIYEKFPQIAVPQHLDMGTLPDDDDIQRVSEALGAAKTRVECCSTFLKAAIKWSTEFGATESGSPEIHDMLAEYIYSQSPEMDMARVSYHFVRGTNKDKFASTLINFLGKCYPGEDDLAIARAILMYLALGNLKDANYLMDEIKLQVNCGTLELQKSDLVQFIDFLLQTLLRDAFSLFNMLRQNYRSSIEREPIFNELLDQIAEKFYGIRRSNSMKGMFSDIFK